MRNRNAPSPVSLLLAAGCVVALLGCATTERIEPPPPPPPEPVPEPMAPPVEPLAPPPVEMGPTDEELLAEAQRNLQDVFYEFDKYDLSAESRAALTSNARYLRGNPHVMVWIEGHCDERGTNEYNLALGEKRARAAHDYLVQAGVDPSRMRVISYGEERPFALGHDEEAWRLNRRAHFRPRLR